MEDACNEMLKLHHHTRNMVRTYLAGSINTVCLSGVSSGLWACEINLSQMKLWNKILRGVGLEVIRGHIARISDAMNHVPAGPAGAGAGAGVSDAIMRTQMSHRRIVQHRPDVSQAWSARRTPLRRLRLPGAERSSLKPAAFELFGAAVVLLDPHDSRGGELARCGAVFAPWRSPCQLGCIAALPGCSSESPPQFTLIRRGLDVGSRLQITARFLF